MKRDNSGKLVALGFLNDSKIAKDIVDGLAKLKRRCRWCNSPLVRTDHGAILCAGLCDEPDPSEYTGPAIEGYYA